MIRSKHFLVIAFSSLIIGVVLASTVIGYSLYIEWKNTTFISRYKSSIAKLTAEMFKEDIAISNINVRIAHEGPFSGLPFIEGSLKNNSPKTITSILMEISFLKPDGSVIYKGWFHPIGEEGFAHSASFSAVEYTSNVLLTGESVSFRHLLRNCPSEVVSQFSSKEEFAKTSAEDRIKMEYSITGVTVL
ncbi:MAG: hypothetical protein ACE5JK_06005 [Candidatus Omnitrophota bacterium]